MNLQCDKGAWGCRTNRIGEYGKYFQVFFGVRMVGPSIFPRNLFSTPQIPVLQTVGGQLNTCIYACMGTLMGEAKAAWLRALFLLSWVEAQ